MLIENAPPLQDARLPDGGAIQSWGLYTMSVRKVSAGAQAASLRAWQYTRKLNDTGRVLTDYLRGGLGSQTTRTIAGRGAQDAYRAFLTMPELNDPAKAFEIRALRFSAINLEGMWLRSHSGGPDYVIPYLVFVRDLRVGVRVTLAEFLRVAQREAARLPKAPEV